MLTEKDYCDYETSRKLKELGFVAGLGEDNCGHCLYDDAWHDQVDRPLLYEAQKWLMEEKGIMVYPRYLTNGQNWICAMYEEKKMLMSSIGRGSYNEVLNEGIKEAVKILKEE